MSSVSDAVSMKIQMLQPTKTQQELAENLNFSEERKKRRHFLQIPYKIHILAVPSPVKEEEPLSLHWNEKEHY